MNRSTITTLIALSLTAGTVGAQEFQVEFSDFRGNGGRVAWSPTGEFVVFDRKEADGGFDLYLTEDLLAEDLETERCLTCNHPDLPNHKRNYGQPAVHPEGRYIVFQALSKSSLSPWHLAGKPPSAVSTGKKKRQGVRNRRPFASPVLCRENYVTFPRVGSRSKLAFAAKKAATS